MTRIAFLLLYSLIVPLLCRSVSAQEIDLEHFLRTDYLKKIDSLKRSLSNVQGKVYHRRTRSEDNLAYEGSGTFHINGVSALVLQEFDKERSPAGFPSVKVYCRTPQYVFHLEKSGANRPFVLKDFDSPSSELRGTAAEIQLRLDLHVRSAFTAGEVPLFELFNTVANRMKRVTYRPHNGTEVVEVLFEEGVTVREYGYDSIRLILDPAMDWALCEYELTSTPSPGVNTARNIGIIQYERSVRSGFVFPKHSRHTELVEYPRKNKIYKTEREATFSDVRWNETSGAPFKLSSYGLPEFGQPKQRSFYPLDHWLFWLCVGLVVVTTIVLRRTRGKVPSA